MTIGIFIGSIREGRNGEHIKNWLQEQTAGRGADYRLLDLKDFDVPLLSSAVVPGAANGQYDDPRVTEWGQAVAECDAFIFVTPEYNHSVPGPMKNAYDSLAVEWMGKPVAFIGYGAAGGVRAVEAWRLVVANMNQPQVRNQLDFNLFTEFGENGLTPHERRAGELEAILDELEKRAA